VDSVAADPITTQATLQGANRFEGIVMAFDDMLAYGEIVAKGNAKFFFHCTQIADGSRNIAVGTAVEFQGIAGRMGKWEAADIRVQTSIPAVGLDATGTDYESTHFECLVCGTVVAGRVGDYEICNSCGWEDDPVQRDDPSFAGGANTLSLNDVRILQQAKHYD
jgi:hypothetical protein